MHIRGWKPSRQALPFIMIMVMTNLDPDSCYLAPSRDGSLLGSWSGKLAQSFLLIVASVSVFVVALGSECLVSVRRVGVGVVFCCRGWRSEFHSTPTDGKRLKFVSKPLLSSQIVRSLPNTMLTSWLAVGWGESLNSHHTGERRRRTRVPL